MSEKTVAEESISKALETLQELAKGHNSRGTATTHVESMRDAGVGAGSDSGSTQVYHTPSNSDPGTWAGTGQRKSPEDGATDGVDENGTDYSGTAEMVKSILDKVIKGQAITDVERALLDVVSKAGPGMFNNYGGIGKKSGAGKDEKEEEMDKAKSKDDDDDDEIEVKVEKSLYDVASEHEDVAKGLEVSSFLSGWADVQGETLRGVESRIRKSLRETHNEQREYNAELAKSIAGLAEVLALQSQRIEQLESTPARAPKSAQAVEKSFGAGGVEPQGERLSKSQVLETMTRMVESGDLSATEVVKFESTNALTPELDSAVRAYRSGR